MWGPAQGNGVDAASSLLAGGVVFGDSDSNLAQDASNFYWDDSNNRLGLGTATPRKLADFLSAAAAQLRLSYSDNSVFSDLQVISGGILTITSPILSGSALLHADIFAFTGVQVGSVANAATTRGQFMGVQFGANTEGCLYYGLKTRSASGSDADTPVVLDDTVLALRGFGADGAAYRQAGSIELAVDGLVGASDMPGRFVVKLTPDGSATPVERLRLTQGGTLLLSQLSAVLDPDVTGTVGTARLVVVGTSATDLQTAFVSYGATADGFHLSCFKTRSSADDANTPVQNGDTVLILEGYGADGVAGGSYRAAGSISLQVDGTPGGSDMPGRWVFKVTPDGSATPATAMTIFNDKTLTIAGPLDHDGSTVGLFGVAPAVQQTVTGARNVSEGALKALLTKLAVNGFIVDSTTSV